MDKNEGRNEWKHEYTFPFVHKIKPVPKKNLFSVYTLFVVFIFCHLQSFRTEFWDKNETVTLSRTQRNLTVYNRTV
jgi:hypothetical protein